jgi:hypothetical protein
LKKIETEEVKKSAGLFEQATVLWGKGSKVSLEKNRVLLKGKGSQRGGLTGQWLGISDDEWANTAHCESFHRLHHTFPTAPV